MAALVSDHQSFTSKATVTVRPGSGMATIDPEETTYRSVTLVIARELDSASFIL